jgi:hypothetical protein
MTKLLEDAISKIRELSASDQDEAARVLLEHFSKRAGRVHLDEETRGAVQRGRAQADRGEFASDEEMAELFSAA